MFTKEEREMIIIGLQMRRNFIQTGDVILSAQDILRMGPENKYKAKINALNDDQMQLVIDTNKLITKLLNM